MAHGVSVWERIGFRRSSGVTEAGWGRTLVVAIVSLIYFLPVLFIIFTAIKPHTPPCRCRRRCRPRHSSASFRTNTSSPRRSRISARCFPVS